jgi:hypothetical protein
MKTLKRESAHGVCVLLTGGGFFFSIFVGGYPCTPLLLPAQNLDSRSTVAYQSKVPNSIFETAFRMGGGGGGGNWNPQKK